MPAEAVEAFTRVGDIWEQHRFDVGALVAYCEAHIDGFVGPVEVAQFHGGASNPTFKLTDASLRSYVLRKQPPGKLLATAHAVDREFRIMKALGPTPVPVPRMLCFCNDPQVIGTPFYLMPFIEGRIYRDNRLSDMRPGERTQAYLGVARSMAALHSINPVDQGLADYGRPGNYFERQIARWTRQYRDAQSEAISSMDDLIERLPARIPAGRASAIVHGDLRMENVMFAPSSPDVVAILDWELSTLGHPLADVGFFCLFYHADFTPWGSAKTIDFATTGIPDERAFLSAYCEATGRAGIDDWGFYLAFSAFRLASIAQGVFQRAQTGASSHKCEHNGARDWADLAKRLLG